MAQTYTLEEAAARLGITPDEMKRRLKEDWKTLRSFRDGPTLRFRAADVDELARSLGAASDPALPLAPMAEEEHPGSDDFKVGPGSSAGEHSPLELGSSDEDVFSLTDEPRPSPAASKPEGDSDVRLEGKPKSGGKKDAAETVPTEEVSLDVGGPGSAVIKGGSSAKLSAPKSSGKLSSKGGSSGKLSAKGDSGKLSSKGDSGKNLGTPAAAGADSSEFELSLEADSSDFELQLNTDSSDEVELGTMPKEKEQGGKPRAGESGINLRDPADSGINLENKKKGDSGKKLAAKQEKQPAAAPIDDSDDFELSLDAGHGGGSAASKSGPKPPPAADSDSEFELTLDDSGEGSSLEAAALESAEQDKGDIFETDFEIPPMTDESGSEAVAVESDTDLEGSEVEVALDSNDVVAEEETGSQVVLLEDEGTGDVAVVEEEAASDVDLADVEAEEEDASVSAAMRKVKKKPREEEEEEVAAAPAAAAAPARWGPWPVIGLALAFIPMFFGGLMGYELLHTMWGYQQPRKPAAPVVKWAATQLDMDLKEQ